MKKGGIITLFALISIFLMVNNVSSLNVNISQSENDVQDYNNTLSLNENSITVEISAIRFIDEIDILSEPDFFIKVRIGGELFVSETWTNTKYIYDCCSFTKTISDQIDLIEINFQLWDSNIFFDTICDISGKKNEGDAGFDVDIVYDLKTGRWYGDDWANGDPSGYGRLNGCDDGSIYDDENDCEIWFDVYQNDPDNDGLPNWVEENIYETDPLVDDSGRDDDEDGLPIEWEHKWGFNPFIWDDHKNLDHDTDSLTNIEEYIVSSFGTDPFRKDLFIEIDYMEESPLGVKNIMPDSTKEILKIPYHRRNIVLHLDTGEQGGGEFVPYDSKTSFDEVLDIYNQFFLHNDSENWRRGVFHYAIIVYESFPAGYGFSGDVSPYWGYIPGTNSFVIGSSHMQEIKRKVLKPLDYVYASAIIHEMGHNFGIRNGNPPGCDVQRSKKPWQYKYWLYRNYKSIMNYRYTYFILDYSDGSHGKRDFDDWEEIDLTYFEIPNVDSKSVLKHS